mmetsp:Transcript_32054/g.73206  ORF Transcript_32054/g.73206 Transcript_32054/m.73206 type:complete len:993 (+) Transcript_32054:28-3006(+)
MFRSASRMLGSKQALLAFVLLSAARADTCRIADVQSEDFPVVEVVIIGFVTFLIAAVLGAIAAWKSEAVEGSLSGCFASLGRTIGRHPIKFILAALFFAVVCSSGFAVQEEEVDPAVLWVPVGAQSLDHRDYVQDVWPSNAVADFYMALPAGGSGNALTPEVLQAMYRDWELIRQIRVDGDEIVELNKDNDNGDFEDVFGGFWSYDGQQPNTNAKCFEVRGGECGVTSILALWNFDAAAIASLTQEEIVTTIAQWEAAPKDEFSPAHGVFKNFNIEQVLGGIARDSAGRITSAAAITTVLLLKFEPKESQADEGDQVGLGDAVMERWEADVTCILGFEEEHPYTEEKCPSPSGLRYVGLLQRSFADEFGSAIQDDLVNVIFAYVLMIFYLVLNLGKRDSVWGMMAASSVVILIVVLSYSMASGVGAFLGVKTNPLLNNIPFLILGLGVDDAFVLAGEMARHGITDPSAMAPELLALTAKTGGISVLVTSLTDALAFLIGSTTKLPALSAFCIYAGIAILFCFLLMMGFYMAILSLNWRRAKDNRYDCVCCCKASTEHKIEQPAGWCMCIPGCGALQIGDNFLQRMICRAGEKVLTTPGKITTVVIFSAVFIVGIIGIVQLETDSEVEWFFPDDSYVTEYFELNRKYFSKGTEFDIYTNSMDIFEHRDTMSSLSSYIACQSFVQQDTVDDWWAAYQRHLSSVGMTMSTERTAFFGEIYAWASTEPGDRYWDDMLWVSESCTKTACNYAEGIGHSRIKASFQLFANGRIRFDTMRTFREDIKDMFGGDAMGVFPFAYDFLFWEEVGIITEELAKNLTIAAGVIFLIVCVLIPKPRVAVIVVVNIIMSIIEVVGFAHYWDLTINGVATIYFLICVGLAVDYSAHIGHTFNVCQGASNERAMKALKQIGPSVVHALMSTLLAICVVAFSKSYVFQVFFKILFLVSVLSGLHGVWLLPALLAIFGGDSAGDEPAPLSQNKVAPDQVPKNKVAPEDDE